jgi:hypothetical protein
MKSATIIGAVLIVLAVIGFSLGGFTITRQKKDVDLGPVQISHEQHTSFPIPPALSWVSLIAGVGLVVVGIRSKS